MAFRRTNRFQLRPLQPKRRNFLRAGDMAVLVIGFTCTFVVKLVGAFPVSEAVTLVLLPFLLFSHSERVFRPGLKTIFYLMALWLGSQIITDIYRNTAAIDWMRGDANIIFFAIDIAGLSVLLKGNDRRKVIFLAAFAVGSLISIRLQPTDYFHDYPWKFGYSEGVNLLVVLASCYFYSRRRYLFAGLMLAGIAAVNLLVNYRSPVLFMMIVLALTMPVIPDNMGRLQLLPRKRGPLRVVFLAAFALGAASVAISLVHLVTRAGVISEAAQEKNEAQSQSGQGLLLGGRPEILVSTRAVMDSPILGHGSWAKDYKYFEMLYDIEGTTLNGSLDSMEASGSGLIPTHSHVMGAWVQAGILGAVFWVYMFWLVLKSLIKVSLLRPNLAPVYAFLLIGFLWDIWFSPFASTRRITEAMLIVVILDVLESSRSAAAGMHWFRMRKWRRIPKRHPAPV